MPRSKSTALSLVETNRLAELELVIKTGFVHALLAIAEIRDAKLWRGTHKSFETYARDHWQLSHTRLYQKLDEAAILGKFLEKGPTVLDLPENERQLQALALVTRGQPTEIIEARWRHVQETTGKAQPTAREIRLTLAPEHKNGAAQHPTRARQQADPRDQRIADLERQLAGVIAEQARRTEIIPSALLPLINELVAILDDTRRRGKLLDHVIEHPDPISGLLDRLQVRLLELHDQRVLQTNRVVLRG